jgi:cell wall-associated NlpC family hydrolase
VRPNLPVVFSIVFALCAGSAQADSLSHTVVSGDSLSLIASHYGVSVAALEARNHLSDTSLLSLGQRIVIPGAVVAARPVTPKKTARPKTHSPEVGAALYAAHVGASRSHGGLSSASPAGAVMANIALWQATHAGSTAPPLLFIDPSSVAGHMLAVDAKIRQTALRYLGVPYSWGGTGFGGVDCSGFVQSVFAKNGIHLPRMADEQFGVGKRIAMSLLLPGDLVFFETYTSGASHVGIYIGSGKFIHASTRGVVIDALSMDYYSSRYLGARRLIQ